MSRRDECLMDSGAVTFYRFAPDESAAPAGTWTLSEIATLPTQERVVGYAHGYAAKAAKVNLARTIRVWDLRHDGLDINAADTLALVQNRYCRILKITPTKDPDALPVLDIDLTDDDPAIRRKIVT